MQVSALLLLCFISATRPQNSYWSPQYPWQIPLRSIDMVSPYKPITGIQPIWHHPAFANGVANRRIEGERTLTGGVSLPRRRGEVDSRAFGLGGLIGFSYLANAILHSLTQSLTSTLYQTYTSTVTAGNIVMCYTATMFASTTACRRKRHFPDGVFLFKDDIIGPDSNDIYSKNGTSEFANVQHLPREGRDVELSHVLASSQNEEGISSKVSPHYLEAAHRPLSMPRDMVEYGRSILFTSTITSYYVYSTSSTKTVTALIATDSSSLLSCLPPGLTLC